ncbi:MAG: HEAT repeat domain-containing protein [Anaerolineaceae bacterium]
MFRLFNFRFDIISLITGFLISSFFWWLSTIFKGWFPKLKALIINKIKVARDRNFSGIDAILRQTTFRRAQHMHLAQSIFPLDEILIIPQVLAPPVSIVNPETLSQAETIADQVIPYIPDWPELSAQYSVARLKLHQVIKYGANIAIIGQPGSGKTVALAYLACQICCRDPQIEEFSSAIPLFVHFLDIDTSADDDPFECLVKSVSKQLPRLAQSRLPTFLKTGLKEGRLILMLDGLDELPSPNLSVAVAYIEKLKKNYPQIQLIVSGSPDCFDGLAKMGFFPLTIAAWSQTERQQFISKWRKFWTDEFVPKTSGQNGQEFFDPFMVENWLDTINPYLNPFELTITVWGAFSADLNGLTVPDAIESYLKRMAAGIPHSALENLGMSILEETQPSLSYVQFEKALGEHAKTATSPMISQPSQPALASSASSSQANPAKTSMKSESKVSSRNQILSILVENGILIDCAQEQVRFVNPLIPGYLASFKIQEDQVDLSAGKLLWVHLIATLHFMSWQNKTGYWLDNFLNQDIPPLYNNLLTVGRWLRDCPSNSLWKPQVMRKLVDLIYEETLPIFIKGRILTAFILSNDPSLPLLFKQMGQSTTPDLRLLSTLGNGAIRNTKALDDLQEMCSDSDSICKNAAVLAIAAVDTEKSLEILANTLLKGDEQLRQAAAEAFSQKPPSGHEVLKEAITLEDILVRRAAVYGLALIRENWSKNILEKTAVQDNQWVVRNIAGQALENMQLPHPNIPRRITPPSETDWILKFAGKQGVGIAPGNTVTDILLKVLKSGTNEERLGALIYLSKTSDEGIIRSIYEVAYTQEGILRQAALYYLWYLSISGVAMPDPAKYGYSY